MKTATIGLPGSLAVMGAIYGLALFFAPAADAAQPTGTTWPGAPADARDLKNKTSRCPYTHSAKPTRHAGMKTMPAMRGGRTRIF